jgi:hypothetical protein
MRKYADDRRWADQFIPEIKRIVGPLLLIEAPFEVDTKQAADLITLKVKDLTIACRVRGREYLGRYGWEFTLRLKRDSGAKTEMEKILEGWGNWMFYGFAAFNDDHKAGFARRFLIDLSAWRLNVGDAARSRRLVKGEAPNGDGTYFAWFDLRSFPPEPRILIASSEVILPPTNDKKPGAPINKGAFPLFDESIILEAIDR